MWMHTKIILLGFIALLTLAGCRNYKPASFTVEGNKAIMTGAIDAKTPERVAALINDHPEVKTIIMQDVEGSVNDEANLVASRRIRQHGFTTHVPANGVIASGGTDFFLAGVERSIE